jgi:methyl-accepting chemotaxis protein
VAHASGRETVLEPYHYTFDGKDWLITSIAVPIIVDSKTVGVLGFDVALDGLSVRFGALRPYERGAVEIISNAGMTVARRGGTGLGEPASTLAAVMAEIKPRVTAGEAFQRTEWSSEIGEEAIQIFSPIKVGTTSRPWSRACKAVGFVPGAVGYGLTGRG